MRNKVGNKEDTNAYRFLKAMSSTPIYVGREEGLSIWETVTNTVRTEDNLSKSLEELMQQPKAYPLIIADRPDIRFICDSFVLGVEYFIFDASEKTKGGSLLEMENAKKTKVLEERHRKSGETIVRENLDVELNYPNYIDSAIKTYDKHVKSIQEYRNNLMEIAKGKPVYLAFCMEDKTTLGSYAVTERDVVEPVCILCVREFLEKLRNCKGLDYIIARYQDYYFSYKTVIMDIDSSIIDLQIEQSYNDSRMRFFSEPACLVHSFL